MEERFRRHDDARRLRGGGVVFLTSGFRGSAAYAVRLADAKGDVSGSAAVLWRRGRDTPYVPSPLLYRDVLYLVKSNSGILTALDAKTGATLLVPCASSPSPRSAPPPSPPRDESTFWGATDTEWSSRRAPRLEVLATSSLDDGFDLSPVVSGKDLYLRGYRHLYKLARE